jgi:hypothetical protein
MGLVEDANRLVDLDPVVGMDDAGAKCDGRDVPFAARWRD